MVMPGTLEMVEGKTSCPRFLTEPELIALMDVNGIGTDATMADHIEKIVERQYVFKQPAARRAAGGGGGEEGEDEEGEMEVDEAPGRGRGRGRGGARGRGGRGRGRGGGGAGGGRGGVMEFIPSTLGIGIVEGYDSMRFDVSLIKPFLRKQVYNLTCVVLTVQMEDMMKDICEGRRTKNDVVQESLRMYREVFIKANREVNVLVQVNRSHSKLTPDVSKIPTGIMRYQ
jgi:DNA topoisomerase-3